jgi:hypothetical protein
VRLPRVAGTLAALLLAAVGVAGADAPPPPSSAVGLACPTSVWLAPRLARIGEPVRYRGRVIVPRPIQVRWVPPASDSVLEWSAPTARRRLGFVGNQAQSDYRAKDTVEVEVELRAFATGMVGVPGLVFRVGDPAGRWRESRLPGVRLAVVPVMSPQDTSASLRPLRGPLGAPWWERVPWRIVGLAALALALVVLAVRLLTRRRAPVAAPARPRPPKDPAQAALEGLEALRGRRLPEAGRFAEHAFHLTGILRRFLEATQGAPLPGDTTPELTARLGTTRLAPAEREQVAELLAAWDRVKFARAASSPAEARRAEDAVEALARRRLAGAGGGGA